MQKQVNMEVEVDVASGACASSCMC